MLLIWDVHINARFKEQVLNNIKTFVAKFPEEKNIIFLGDYVYHFTYDRKSLLEFFDILVSLFQEGKNIYVLAWNHDRINESFVFEEAKKSFDILNQNSKNKLYFITQAFLEEIEWKKILFLPFNINLNCKEDVCEWVDPFLEKDIQMLHNSKNSNERFSSKLNNLLLDYYANSKEDLFVFHHYYFANIQFPGQKTKFSFKNIALSEKFLDYKNLFFLSWHLHNSFCYKNYFCTWDIWNISSLEQNKFNFLYKFDIKNCNIYPEVIYSNIYLSLDWDANYWKDKVLDNEIVNELIENIKNINLENWKSFVWNVSFQSSISPDIEKIILILYSQIINYDNLKSFISEELFYKFYDIKIKTQNYKISEIVDLLWESQKDLQHNISDWKNLLEKYIRQKFWENSKDYIQKLKDLKIFQ